MRALIYFPILHNEQDLGSLSQVVGERLTEKQQQQYIEAVSDFWTLIRRVILEYELDYKKVKVFQDGLPVCGKELDIITEVAQSGSENHKILLELHQKGAQVQGTESPELLVKEYNLMKQMLTAEHPQEFYSTEAKVILNQRDEAIAQRIDTILADNEMGILFLGLAHNIAEKLPKDIVLIEPLGRPSFGENNN